MVFTQPRELSLAPPCIIIIFAVIFSLGPACGCLLTMSSYSKFDRNCHRDAVIIALANCATSVFCGVVVFSALGFIAHDKGVQIEEVKLLTIVL